jgi:hypothetical protein
MRSSRRCGVFRVGVVLGSIAAVFGLSVVGAAPANADTEIPGNAGQFDWAGAKSIPFCYGEPIISTDTVQCESGFTIGEINFNIRVTLNGRAADMTTNWQVTSGGHNVRVFSMVECRKDEFVDDSCGWAGVQPYEDYATFGSFSDSFPLDENGKYFFNLHYVVAIEGSSVGPGIEDGSLDMILGTSHRIKCSSSRAPYYCEMA